MDPQIQHATGILLPAQAYASRKYVTLPVKLTANSHDIEWDDSD